MEAIQDLTALKARQQLAWSAGDYALIGTGIQLIAELLVEALDPRSTWHILDVAAGSGNASLAAARRNCLVTSTDYVPSLLERGKQRATAEGLEITFVSADAEALPFRDNHFDAALSTVGVMFAPNQQQAAAELFRVIKPGGRIGLASWTPDSFVGRIFRVMGKYLPPPAGLQPPSLWGTEAHLRTLFPDAAHIDTTQRAFTFRNPTPQHWLESFRTYYGPMNKAFAALHEPTQQLLSADLLKLCAELNRSGDPTLVLPSDYLEAVIHKS
jgi:ubiquinone/menaquinone biosynthesis C-methylase UbiE